MKKNQVTDIRELELQEQKLKSIGQAGQEKKLSKFKDIL